MQAHSKNIIRAGVPLEQAEKILIMLHGRGATAKDILSLTQYFSLPYTHVMAPQATNYAWYPYSFLAPVQQNEPWLSSALNLLKEILDEIISTGFESQQVYFLGFSQGACLTLEFAARNARPYGGVIAFTGGLIGDVLNERNYTGDFQQTKIFIGNSDRDPHVPLSRSEQSKKIIEKQSAAVTLKVYPGMLHTINDEELDWVNKNIFASPSDIL